VSSRGASAAIAYIQHGLGILAAPGDRPADDVGADGMEGVFEAGRDAEVAAAATYRPEQVAVLALRGAHHPAVGGDEVDGRDVVARPPEPAREVAEPAAERQPGAAGVRDEAEHGRQAVELRLAIHR
jgi:hypothetical protein